MHAVEIVNLLIVLSLLAIMKQRRDVVTLLIILFFYGMLHFAFAALALTSNESKNLLIVMHQEGGGILAKLSTLLLLASVFFVLCWHAFNAYLIIKRNEKKIILYVLLVMAALLCGYLFNIRQSDGLQLKNVASIEAMFAFLLIGFIGLLGSNPLNIEIIYKWFLVGLFILFVADGIAFYEIFWHHSWAGTLESSGAMVYRASSILFNPNLFAFWASFVYLGCAYGMQAYNGHQKIMLLGMILASIAIYLSGARSAGYLLLGVLSIPAILIRKRMNWYSLIVFPLTMLTIYFGIKWFVMQNFQNDNGWHEIILLGDRFAATPQYLISYIAIKFSNLFGVPVGVPVGVLAGVPAEISLSIEGRFVGDGRDSGWLVLYQDVGLVGTVAMLWMCTMSFWWAVRGYMATHSVSSVYALMILCYCLMTGIVMRIQIFPVWLFISVFLTPCLVLWSREVDSKLILPGMKCAH